MITFASEASIWRATSSESETRCKSEEDKRVVPTSAWKGAQVRNHRRDACLALRTIRRGILSWMRAICNYAESRSSSGGPKSRPRYRVCKRSWPCWWWLRTENSPGRSSDTPAGLGGTWPPHRPCSILICSGRKLRARSPPASASCRCTSSQWPCTPAITILVGTCPSGRHFGRYSPTPPSCQTGTSSRTSTRGAGTSETP